MTIAIFRKTATAAVTAIAMLGASAQMSSALPLDTLTMKSANAESSVQNVGWTTKQKQAAGWGLAAGLLTGIVVTNAYKKNKKNDAVKMHIAYCSGKWNTYNPNTNMYMSTTGPKYCYSPYL